MKMEEHAEFYLYKKITNEGRKWRVGGKKMKQCIKLLEPVISIWHASQQ